MLKAKNRTLEVIPWDDLILFCKNGKNEDNEDNENVTNCNDVQISDAVTSGPRQDISLSSIKVFEHFCYINIAAEKIFLDITWKKKGLKLTDQQLNLYGNTSLPSYVLELKIKETDLHGIQKDIGRPPKITKSDIGITLYVSLDHLLNIRSYWSEDRFPENKKIHFLHFNNNETALPRDSPNYNRLHKVRPLVDALNTNFSKDILEQYLSVDLAGTYSWMLYRKVQEQKNCQTACLTQSVGLRYLITKREKLSTSVEEQQQIKKKKGTAQTLEVKEVRLDEKDHWPS
ncbi:hypothetical protein ILUMI_26312 [Ignelater luminosus]|uniref:Uncharacterized protein n=1 Tax=Ignelater luminosus TaxID=2038154 RepID=A0A8K0FVY6_IGNLU|nr:hypothetical protein ILUMI_26312 [Ignelater luminosus]